MDDSAPATPLHWRPAPAWLAAGLILGAPCGAVVGAVMLVAGVLLEGEGPGFGMALFGGFYGGFFGGVIGLVVGFVMTFLGGSHLPGNQARERAFLVAFVSTGLIVFVLLGGFFGFHPIAIVAAFVSALAGGSLSCWLASLGMRSCGTGLELQGGGAARPL